MDVRFTSPTTLADALTAAAAGTDRSPAGPISSSGHGRASGRCPRTWSRWTGSRSCAGSRGPPDGLRIGATTSHADLAGHPDIRERWTAIADAASIVGSPATRHVGTLGGNIANASPAAETSGPLLCFDAQVELRSSDGRPPDRARRRVQRSRPDDDPSGRAHRRRRRCPSSTARAAATSDSSSAGRWRSRSSARRPSCASRAGSSATPGSPSPPSPRRSGGSPWPRPRSSARTAGPAAAAEAGRLAAEAATPISDVRASLEYRRAMAAVVVRRAVTGAIARARGETIPIPASASLFGAR